MVLVKDEFRKTPREELETRLKLFRQAMDALHPGWEMFITNYKVTLFYFTGTIVDGVLIIRPNDAVLWVRKSLDRAVNESYFKDIRPMRSLREAAAFYGKSPETVYVEKKKATLDWQDFVHKYFPFERIVGVDAAMEQIRSVKSSFELGKIRKSGIIHEEVLDKLAKSFIKEGMSETELAVKVYGAMLERGSQGIMRFNHGLGDETIGICDFGKSGLVAQGFDGPGGCAGTCIAMQNIGNPGRRLRKNQLVYMDIACGYDGYHTDKTTTYYYGDISADPLGNEILAAHNYCLKVENELLNHMVIGETLENAYIKTMDAVGKPYGNAFMGGEKFLGHSVGLVIDEAPAIAKGFKQEFSENMVFALEPKVALKDAGMVGIENTYVITKDGPKSLTGKSNPLIIIR